MQLFYKGTKIIGINNSPISDPDGEKYQERLEDSDIKKINLTQEEKEKIQNDLYTYEIKNDKLVFTKTEKLIEKETKQQDYNNLETKMNILRSKINTEDCTVAELNEVVRYLLLKQEI